MSATGATATRPTCRAAAGRPVNANIRRTARAAGTDTSRSPRHRCAGARPARSFRERPWSGPDLSNRPRPGWRRAREALWPVHPLARDAMTMNVTPPSVPPRPDCEMVVAPGMATSAPDARVNQKPGFNAAAASSSSAVARAHPSAVPSPPGGSPDAERRRSSGQRLRAACTSASSSSARPDVLSTRRALTMIDAQRCSSGRSRTA